MKQVWQILNSLAHLLAFVFVFGVYYCGFKTGSMWLK